MQLCDSSPIESLNSSHQRHCIWMCTSQVKELLESIYKVLFCGLGRRHQSKCSLSCSVCLLQNQYMTTKINRQHKVEEEEEQNQRKNLSTRHENLSLSLGQISAPSGAKNTSGVPPRYNIDNPSGVGGAVNSDCQRIARDIALPEKNSYKRILEGERSLQVSLCFSKP